MSPDNNTISPTTTNTKINKNNKKKVFTLYILLLFIIGLSSFSYYWFCLKDYESTDDAFIDTNIAKVSAAVPGRVDRILVEDNQYVEAGSVLIELDARDYQNLLNKAIAAQNVALAQTPQLHNQIEALEANLKQTQANVKSAEAEYQRDKDDYDRYQKSQQTWSQSQLSMQHAAFKASAGRLDAARQSVIYNQALLNKGKAALEENNAQLKQLEVEIENAKLQLSYTKIIAPQSGHVTKRSVELGSYIDPGRTLLSVVSNNVWITANFKETQLANMRPGQEVEVAIDAYPQYKYSAKIDSIQRGTGPVFSMLPAENATGNYIKVVQRVPVKILFTDPRINDAEHPLSPGMSVVPNVHIK
ncbi:HlyD family secretion protein [Limnobaculum zhutongyuii]|uniref:HlyD family secretion protein n=1 Tax=Limnobaculum zhutongyuii TaxID=2498113 RepID=A0A411WMA2_9GAMM|nr:HlyD family secretion protein [Limnobaculum zhutongyuii]QBH97277.1 HlyD family secretion protein [Limnobaculum zhutongyuii]TQS88536.1 HlyD family secretion protein [Limnobaculum zhutongyuii]